MILADTNLVIYAADPTNLKARAWLLATVPAVSGTTRVEALGYHNMTPAEEVELLNLFAVLIALPIDRRVEDEAIRPPPHEADETRRRADRRDGPSP